jgi:23S rRNA (uracil1939-C5)-methyltransferase
MSNDIANDLDDDRLELPRSPRPETFWTLEIEAFSVDGLGIAHLPARVGPQREAKDFEFHVRKAVPGDLVEVEVERRRGEHVDARLDTLVEPSSMRTEPRCQHFGRREVEGEGCGGCTFQSIDYRHQLAVKERAVTSSMVEHGVDPGLVRPVEGCDEPWHYRNNMEFSFGDTAEREFALGMYPTGYKYEVLNLDECYLQSPFTSALLPRVREWAIDHGVEPYINPKDEGFLRLLTVREGKRTGERLINLTTTHAPETSFDGESVPAESVAEAFGAFVLEVADDLDTETTSIYWTQKKAIQGQPTEFIDHHLHGKPMLEERLHLPGDEQLHFEIHPRAFFQTNTLQAEVLYEEVLEQAGLLEGDETKDGCILDLYCGTGTIALCMAPYADRVVGVEMQPDAVDNARENAAHNDVDNATFLRGDVREVLDSEAFDTALEGSEPDLTIVDPPRSGLLEEARDHIDAIGTPRFVYVSCHPESLARDLADFQERGYEIECIQPIDMFPQTYHVENVVSLRRRPR